MSNNEADRLAEQIKDIIDEHLTAFYACTRVWEAWGVGTMTKNDFVPASETEFADELTAALLAALAKQQAHEATEQRQALAALREIAGGIRLYGAPDQNLLADRIEKRVEELATLTTHEATQAAAVGDYDQAAERVTFEAWAREAAYFHLDKTPRGFYTSHVAENCWIAWQERAALAPPSPAQSTEGSK